MTASFSTWAVLAVFYAVFLSQIVLISIYYPAKVRRRVLHILDHYPPDQYPKLYPDPLDIYAELARRTRLRTYRFVNLAIAALGLMVLAAMLVTAYRPDPKGGDEILVVIYFFVQMAPLIYAEVKEFNQYRLMRAAYSAPLRQADLKPRRLFDFVSPVYVFAAVVMYVVWMATYLFGLDPASPWSAEVVLSMIGVTAMNVLFAWAIARAIGGKKPNPHQAHADRLKQIEVVTKSLIFGSIMVSFFLIVTQLADQHDWEIFDPPLTSLYLQLAAVFGIGLTLRSIKVDEVDFEVYKEKAQEQMA
ncbi:MAG: hypothetical protein DHS20C11_25080 [Lysobacteraceae bacterium]|nr:MAG: hypothetical protein DHS20C11_25080 [Xanthomonadaceae bacterium]